MLSSVLIVPDANLCVATMTNRTSGNGLELALGHWLLERALDVPDRTDWLGGLKMLKAQSDADDGSSAATNSYKEMLPGVMADSIMSAGGLGLAATIAQSLKESGQ